MPLPSAIFESFAENPGTDLDATTGTSVLDTLNENSPLMRMLGKSSQIISKQTLPTQNEFAIKPDYNTDIKPLREEFSGEREVPTTAELMSSRLQKIQEGSIAPQKPILPPQTYAQPQQSYIQPQQVYAQPQTTMTIDYSLINSMLKTIVAESMSGLKTQLLIESKGNTMNEAAYLTVGQSIKFVDKKGNIYEGKLKKVGNVND